MSLDLDSGIYSPTGTELLDGFLFLYPNSAKTEQRSFAQYNPSAFDY